MVRRGQAWGLDCAFQAHTCVQHWRCGQHGAKCQMGLAAGPQHCHCKLSAPRPHHLQLSATNPTSSPSPAQRSPTPPPPTSASKASRPMLRRSRPSAASCFSTTICVAMPAWSASDGAAAGRPGLAASAGTCNASVQLAPMLHAACPGAASGATLREAAAPPISSSQQWCQM